VSDDLIEQLEDKISIFEPQYEENDCFSTCLRNIIRKYSYRKTGKKNSFKISKSDLNEFTRYNRTTASTADMKYTKKKLDEELKAENIRAVFEFTSQSQSNMLDRDLDVDFISYILSDQDKSLPIVSFSTDYYDDPNFPWEVTERFRVPHTVIILHVEDEERIYIWDGLISFKNDNDIGDGIIDLPTERFIRYWDNYFYSKEICWLSLESQMEVDRY